MMTSLKIRTLAVGLLAAVVLGFGAPAYAQNAFGSLKGRAVDEKGTPVPDADIVYNFVGEIRIRYTAKTDKNGQFLRAGLAAVGGTWTVTITKGPLTGTRRNIDIPLGAVKTLEDIVLSSGEAVLGAPDPAAAAAAAEYAKQVAALKQLSADIDTAMEAKQYDTAIGKINEVLGVNASCKACYVMLGDAYLKKESTKEAEDSYKKAIELDPQMTEAYEALVVLYNQQKRYDEATKTSAKVAELRSAGTGGNVDPVSLYNQGVLLWNQGKIAESRAQFEKAIKAKPDLAEAYYYIGMAIINEGKDMAAAGKMLQEYVRLAPQGPHAAEANAMIPDLK